MRHLPAPDRLYRHYFLLYPLAVETADLREYDVVVSYCWGHAKGVRTRPDALHVCYCQTPMRWAWRYDDYVAREEMGAVKRLVLPWLIAPLRRWDLRASTRPDFLIANSATVADRIRLVYSREATVIYPPIDLDRFASDEPLGDSYLIVSRLMPYKRIDLAIEACNLLGRRLVIIGDGPDRQRLQRIAGPRSSSWDGSRTRWWRRRPAPVVRCCFRVKKTSASYRWRSMPPAGRWSRGRVAGRWRR